MQENIAKVFAIYKTLGIKPDTKSFENRIIMQKTICLLDMMGLKTGFKFGMYLRGPYSPALTKAIFDKIDSFEKNAESANISKEDAKKIKELKETADMKAPVLEIAATYGYLTNIEHKRMREAMEILQKTKPFYSLQQIMSGISVSKQLLSKPSPELIETLHKEMEPWHQMADEDFAGQVKKYNL